MKKLFFAFCIITFLGNTHAQNSNFWVPINESKIAATGERTIIPKEYRTFHLVNQNLKTILWTAPDEKNISLTNSPVIIELPMPDGTMEKFRVVYSPVMAPELAVQFPDIKTFNVQGVDDQTTFGKLDWNDFGFHGMIRKTSGDIFIDPYSTNNVSDYITYNTADFQKDPDKMLPEIGVLDTEKDKKKEDFSADGARSTRAMICAGESLRTYRLAVACTGEYAKAATGLTTPSVSQILSKVVTTVNRVDGVYETEVAIKLVLVGTETSILYANPSTDPFSGNDDGGTLIDESQTVIDNIIGSAYYDIGHTFSTGGGGLASLGCVCSSGRKASGITGSGSPVGDPYDIDYVAHEMGHQFSGNHTFAANTGGCSGNGNSSTRVEPGSGVTIMAYAGLCDNNNVASNSIAYFHSISFDEIMDYTTNDNGNSCAVITTTGNRAPVVTTAASYNIPFSTPFMLTGSATDEDGNSLTYQWEQTNVGSSGNWNSGNAPYFRSYAPTTSPSRLFPKLSVIMNGNLTGTIGEYLPSNPQTLKFRLTARDNQVGGGGVCYASSQVKVASSGPFAVTYPNTSGIVWSTSLQTVTWDVNGTTAAPVSCSLVNILISIDSGVSFTMLLANTPNDGSEVIMVPTLSSTKTGCRIKIESVGNIFFDVNDKSFTINAGITGVSELSLANTIVLQLQPNPFNDEVMISFNGLDKTQKTNLIIYDLLGKVLLTDSYYGQEELKKQYDLSFLSKGVYIIDFSNSKQKSVSRLVKQ